MLNFIQHNGNMPAKKLRIATRESPLALWQANYVKNVLIQHWPDLSIHLVPMSTSGDRFIKDRLIKAGGKGLFVKELEEALLDDRADIAVHSMKDVPARFPEGLFLPVICSRENPFDAFVSEKFSSIDELPHGARIGTSSLRRQTQLLAYNPHLKIITLRGNVNTRLRKLEEEEFDAIILAAAGLNRLELNHHIRHILSPQVMLPACGQGALGIECRVQDKATQALIAPLNDPVSSLCVSTEREVNSALGGSCQTPIAIFCCPQQNGQISLEAKVGNADGTKGVFNKQQGLAQEASDLAQRCIQALFAAGADEFLL